MTFQVGKTYRNKVSPDVVITILSVLPTRIEYVFVSPSHMVDERVHKWDNYAYDQYEEVVEEMKFEVNKQYTNGNGQIVTCTAVSTTGKPIFLTKEGKEFVAKNPENFNEFRVPKKYWVNVYPSSYGKPILSQLHETKEAADLAYDSNTRIKIIEVEI